MRKNSLYFTASRNPTEAEQAEADKMQISGFRNAKYVGLALERADFVAGDAGIIERYRKEMPGTKVLSLKAPEGKPGKGDDNGK